MIEAGADMKRETEKEWYYGNKDKERLGPYSFDEVGIMETKIKKDLDLIVLMR